MKFPQIRIYDSVTAPEVNPEGAVGLIGNAHADAKAEVFVVQLTLHRDGDVLIFQNGLPLESANEAARRAVNAILQKSGSNAKAANVWPMYEPPFFAPMIEFDRIRFKLGLPHSVGPL
jgi:hypothetical protein